MLGRQPHHIVSTLLHAVWHRSRRSSTSDGDVEESNQSRNCPSPEGSRQCCARNHRIGRVQDRAPTVAPSTDGSPGEFDRAPIACVAGPWTEGRLALAGTGGGSDQGLPRFSSSVAPQFPPQKANRPVGSCGAAPAGWLWLQLLQSGWPAVLPRDDETNDSLHYEYDTYLRSVCRMSATIPVLLYYCIFF